MRLVFAGTPAVAIPTLRLLAARHEVVAVVTRPDAPLGRRRVLTPSPVAAAAEELRLPVVKADRLGAEATERIAALRPELGVVVAYGGLVREPLLSAPEHGWINLHFSLLPRWRGAAPVQHALIAGDDELGASVFRLVAELDAGDVYAERVVPVPGEAVAGEVLDLLAEDGAGMTADVVEAIGAGRAAAEPQRGEVTLAPKLSLADGELEWARPLSEVYARFRGVTPEPGAHTSVHGERLKILQASPATDADAPAAGEVRGEKTAVLIGTATAPLRVTRVQPAGRAAMAAGDWFRGLRADGAVEVGS